MTDAERRAVMSGLEARMRRRALATARGGRVGRPVGAA